MKLLYTKYEYEENKEGSPYLAPRWIKMEITYFKFFKWFIYIGKKLAKY